MSTQPSTKIRIEPEIAFGKLNLRTGDETRTDPIPAWLIDRPDVLRALTILAERGGTKCRSLRARNFEDLEIDTAAGTVVLVDADQ